jgi:DNA-binding MarR family transcriptional regulator
MHRAQFTSFNKSGTNGNGHHRDPFLEFSLSVSGFLRASKRSASEAGLTVMEYDLLLALSAFPSSTCPNIAILCERLLIHHHVASEAVGRLADRELLRTRRSARDRRSVTLILSANGEALLKEIAVGSAEALREQGPRIAKSLGTLVGKNGRSTLGKM